jgi:HEAT repeat protein
LRNPDVKTRLSAVQQLGNAGYAAAAEYVAPLITDEDNNVQFAAIDAELTFFLVEPIAAKKVIMGGSKSRAQEAFDAGPLVRTAAEAPLIVVDSLISAMHDKNDRIRFDAVHAVGVIAQGPLPPAQSKALIDGLDHFDPVIRTATARVLGRLHATEAGDRLIAGLNDSSPLVRRYCAEALGLIQETRAVTSLTDLTDYYGHTDMGHATFLALARIGHPSSRDIFRTRFNDPDAEFRRAAAEGLGRVKDRDSLPALTAMMTSEPNAAARLAAMFAVCVLGQSQAAQSMVAALASPETFAQARDYLLELGPAAAPAVQAELQATKDSHARADLIHILGFIGGQSGQGIVDAYTRDKDERVNRAATNALARLARPVR